MKTDRDPTCFPPARGRGAGGGRAGRRGRGAAGARGGGAPRGARDREGVGEREWTGVWRSTIERARRAAPPGPAPAGRRARDHKFMNYTASVLN